MSDEYIFIATLVFNFFFLLRIFFVQRADVKASEAAEKELRRGNLIYSKYYVNGLSSFASFFDLRKWTPAQFYPWLREISARHELEMRESNDSDWGDAQRGKFY